MELGEAITIPDIFLEPKHDESLCPWHTSPSGTSTAMAATHPDDDAPDAIPENDGGKLGTSLTGASETPPAGNALSIAYAAGEVLLFGTAKKPKSVQLYGESATLVTYALQYAAHHLIPGNEALKGSDVVPYMGDATAIGEYAKGKASLIKDGFFIGYDVNAAKNGVWLPAPYALSNKNNWPAAPGIKVIKVRKGQKLAKETEDFKEAYVAASIRVSGGRQFHMRHLAYSNKVRDILNAIAQRMSLMAGGSCPIAAKSAAASKFDPPYGLVGRLNVLSANMKRFLIGDVWRDPLFTDEMTKDYAQKLLQSKATGTIDKVV